MFATSRVSSVRVGARGVRGGPTTRRSAIRRNPKWEASGMAKPGGRSPHALRRYGAEKHALAVSVDQRPVPAVGLDHLDHVEVRAAIGDGTERDRVWLVPYRSRGPRWASRRMRRTRHGGARLQRVDAAEIERLRRTRRGPRRACRGLPDQRLQESICCSMMFGPKKLFVERDERRTGFPRDRVGIFGGRYARPSPAVVR